MAKTTTRKELIVYAVTLLLKAVLLAAASAGKARRKGLESIAEMSADEKDKEIVFLRDQVHQLRTQVEILQKRCHASSKKPRHTLKERLFILWHMAFFQIPRSHVSRYLVLPYSSVVKYDRSGTSGQLFLLNQQPDEQAQKENLSAGKNIPEAEFFRGNNHANNRQYKRAKQRINFASFPFRLRHKFQISQSSPGILAGWLARSGLRLRLAILVISL